MKARATVGARAAPARATERARATAGARAIGGGYSRKGDSGGKDSCDTKGNNCGKGGRGEGVSCGD